MNFFKNLKNSLANDEKDINQINLEDYGPETQKYLKEFERLNKSEDSIYDLRNHEVLIILDDGTNLTDWDDVESKEDVLYVSEDLSKQDILIHKYDDLENVKIIIAKNVTDKVESLYKMFSYCSSLKAVIGLETWDVSEVYSLECTFGWCKSLTDLKGIGKWDVSKVNDMSATFISCHSLENLDDLINWNTSGLEKLWSTFSECIRLNNLKGLKNWDVSNVNNMVSLFSDCDNLTSLDGLEDWDTSSLTSTNSMFWECNELSDIKALKNWNTSNLKDMCRMFRGCEPLADLSGLSDWDVSGVSEMTYTFLRCKSLTNLDALSKWDVSGLSNARSMFDSCTSLENIQATESWNFKSIVTLERMFDECSCLADVSASESWKLPDKINTGAIFRNTKVVTNPFERKLNLNLNGPKKLDIPKEKSFMFIYGVGWCSICLGDIYSRASYITDVPGDCLRSIIKAIRDDCDFKVNFNAEGYSFTVEADNKQCYFNFLGGEQHEFDNINKYDLAIEIYENISNDLGSWEAFSNSNLTDLMEELNELIENF